MSIFFRNLKEFENCFDLLRIFWVPACVLCAFRPEPYPLFLKEYEPKIELFGVLNGKFMYMSEVQKFNNFYT